MSSRPVAIAYLLALAILVAFVCFWWSVGPAAAASPPPLRERAIAGVLAWQRKLNADADLARTNARLRVENRRLRRRLAYHGRRVRALQRTLRHRPDVLEAIRLGAIAFGVPQPTMRRRAFCESRLDPRSRNRASGASGLFNFLPSTWRTTPFAGLSIWSPYANALAAGWMMGPAGRGDEWQCR